MFKRLLLVLLLCSPLMGQKSYRGTSNDWSPFHNDKATHVFAGALIGSSAFLTAERLGYKYPMLHGLFWALLAGAIKENYDKNHGGRPEYADVFWTGAGSVLITIPLQLDRNKKRHYATAPKLDP